MTATTSAPLWRYPILSVWVTAAVLLGITTGLALRDTQSGQPGRALVASVFREPSPAGEPVFVGPDASLDPMRLASAHGLDPRLPFAVEWRGHLVVSESGTHHLRARADDGVAVWVDGGLILDRLTHLGEQEVSVPVRLDEGLHPIRVRYAQAGGDGVFRLSWATPRWREEFVPLRVVADASAPDTFERITRADRRPRQLAIAWSAWVLGGLLLAFARLVAWAAGAPRITTVLDWRHVALLAVVALPLLAVNIEIGTQPWRSWAADEVLPKHALDAWNSRFGSGWFHLYPPLSFYLLNLVHAPLVLMTHAGAIGFGDPEVHTAMHVIDRGVSVGLAWLTLLTVGLLAHQTVGGRARVLAPYVLLGVPLFAFYARTTNVDMAYAFWFAVAAVAFLRAVTTRAIRDHVMLGALVAAAVATKDQAYGLFVAAAIALAWHAWRDSGPAAPALVRAARTATDRRLWAGLLACAVVYSVLMGAWWNLEGVRAHFALITGGSAPFRMFPVSAHGFETLAATTLAITWQTLGPVASLATLAGLTVSLAHGAAHRLLWLLVALPVAYLFTFVGVVGYIYDRFLLGLVVVLAIVAARGLDWGLQAIPRGVPRAVATLLAVGVLLAPTAVLGIRQAADSRVRAEAWMQASLTDDPLVLGAGSPLYLPNLFPFQHRIEPRTSTDNLLSWEADAIVLYEDWFGRPGQPTRDTVRRTLGQAGYVERFTARPAAPPDGWVPSLFSGLCIDPVFSNVGKINPPLSIWQRDQRGGTPAGGE